MREEKGMEREMEEERDDGRVERGKRGGKEERAWEGGMKKRMEEEREDGWKEDGNRRNREGEGRRKEGNILSDMQLIMKTFYTRLSESSDSGLNLRSWTRN